MANKSNPRPVKRSGGINATFLGMIFLGICILIAGLNIGGNIKKLNKTMEDFRQCATMVSGQRAMLWKAFFFNVLQRLSQLFVTVSVYMAAGGTIDRAKDVFVTQSFVAIGSNCAPIPGAMGVADYLMLDGFGKLMSDTAATNLELLSRSLSFYVLIAVSGITVVVGYLVRRIKKH